MSREEQWFLRLVEYTSVAAAFALCGALSLRLLPGHPFVGLLFPLPFAVLSALLFLRSPKAILSVALSVPVYFAAQFTANVTAAILPWLCMCLGGSVGGAGLAFAFGFVRPRLLSLQRLLRVAGVGAVAAVPFVFWFTAFLPNFGKGPDPREPLLLLCSFATWQAVVGTYLYAVCARAGEKARPTSGHRR